MKIAMYQSTEYDWMQTVADVSVYRQNPEKWVLISNIIDVEFEITNSTASQDAIRANGIKRAQDDMQAAQERLDKLLGEK